MGSVELLRRGCEPMKASRSGQSVPARVYVALLRAVNVGGTGKLAMSDLKTICLDAGFSDAKTYIASGNVVFQARMTAKEAKAALEERLGRHVGKPVGVAIRTADELAAILETNPFKKDPPSKTIAIFWMPLRRGMPCSMLRAGTRRRCAWERVKSLYATCMA